MALKIYRGSELQYSQTQSRWLLQSLLPASSCVFLIAEPKVGKSFCALSMGLAVASGKSCFGNVMTMETGAVVHLAAEDAACIVGERLSGIAKAMNCSDKDLTNIHIVDRSNDVFLDDPDSFERFRQALLEIRPKLVTLDPFAQLLSRTHESSAKQMTEVLRRVRKLQMELDCTILICHHTKKQSSDGSINSKSRGSSHISSFWDGVLLAEKSFNGITRIRSEWKGFPLQPEQYVRLENLNGGFAPMTVGMVKVV